MGGLQGTWTLVRLGLRRDRVLLPAWISVLVLTVVVSASATTDLYPTIASRVEAADAVNSSPALVAMFGRIYDPTSLGAIAMVKMVAFGAAAVAVLAAMITVRHTRTEEETGRLELLGATALGRQAPLTAALVIASLTSLTAGALAAIGLMQSGLPAAGSVAFGAEWAGAGIAFAAVGAVAAQVARTARNATGVSVGVIAACYVLRAVGDTSDTLPWLVWLSPFGWVHHVQAFAGNRWPVLLLLLAFAVVASASAYVLGAERDLGAGLFADRPGPAHAGSSLQGTVGLAWRLERGSLLAWTAGFALLGLVVGGVAGNVGSFLNSSESQDVIRRLGGEKGLIDAYLAAELGVLGLVIAAYGVHAALRLRTEETSQRADELLATGVGRVGWAGSHLLVALGGTVCLAATAGLTAGIARAAQTGQADDVLQLLAGALVQLPAVWVVIGIVAAGYGLGARFAIAGWVALVLFVLLGEIGPLLKLPHRIITLSPFAHVPKLPGSPVGGAALIALLGIAVLLTGIGLVGFRQRDLS
ncbi:MAG: ABC transporter permease [Acidimicrobiales bacterium]